MKKRLLGILLSFALMLTMMPVLGLSLTAYAETYSVTKHVSDGGSVSVTVNDIEVTSAEENASVTLTASPAEGKQLKSIEATYMVKDLSTLSGLAEAVSTVKYFDEISYEYLCVDGNSLNIYYVQEEPDPDILKATATGVSFDSQTGEYTVNFNNDSYSGLKISFDASGKILSFSKGSRIFSSSSPDRVKVIENIALSGSGNTRAFTMPAAPVAVKAVFEAAPVTEYPLWVGGTQVTSANKDDPGNRGWSYTPATTGENATPAKLTLNNYIYSGLGIECAAIYANENLTIELNGANTVTQTGSTANSFGIYVGNGKSLTITGSGSLTSNAGPATGYSSEGIYVGDKLIIEEGATVTATGGMCQSGDSYGVQAYYGLTVKGSLTARGNSDVSNSYGAYIQGEIIVGETGTVNATGKNGVFSGGKMTISGSVTAVGTGRNGIWSNGEVEINGGTVEATANGNYGIGIQTIFGDVVINGGTVEASATGRMGCGINTNAYIVVVNNATSFISIGDAIAIGKLDPESGGVKPGNVKNAIAGTGWEYADGSGKKTDIAVNTSDEGQPLDFKKVQFPAEADKVTVKFDSAGGSAVAAQTINKGAKATKPADPTRSGYIFNGWYKGNTAFDFSTAVNENMTLTAHWKQNAKPSPSKKTVRTVLVTKALSAGNTKAKVSWNNAGADRYVVYYGICGKSMKKYKTVNGKTRSVTVSKLRRGGMYKFRIVAQKKSGKSYKNIATSGYAHMTPGNVCGRYTNVKDLKVNRKAVNLSKGRTFTVKTSLSKVRKNKRLFNLSHDPAVRYITSDPGVAVVNSKGKITAKGKGTCYVYVQAVNGIWKTVKVTVK